MHQQRTSSSLEVSSSSAQKARTSALSSRQSSEVRKGGKRVRVKQNPHQLTRAIGLPPQGNNHQTKDILLMMGSAIELS